MESLLISACLLGVSCRYDGKSCGISQELLQQLRSRYHLIAVCPEQLGGLPTPRMPAERVGERVLRRDGGDVTEQYARGAAETLRLASFFGCKTAVLKEHSPSCGCGVIYDGTFSGTFCNGNGVTAALLLRHGIRVLGETKIEQRLLGE